MQMRWSIRCQTKSRRDRQPKTKRFQSTRRPRQVSVRSQQTKLLSRPNCGRLSCPSPYSLDFRRCFNSVTIAIVGMNTKKNMKGSANTIVGIHVNQCVVPSSQRTVTEITKPIASITGDTMNGSIVAKPLRIIGDRRASIVSSSTLKDKR